MSRSGTVVRLERSSPSIRKRRHDAYLLGNEIVAFWSAQGAQCSRYLRIGEGIWTPDEQRLLETLHRDAVEHRAAPRIPDEQMKALEAIVRKFLRHPIAASVPAVRCSS